MGRPKHGFWQYVNGTNDAWECKFCGHKGSGGSRIKSHLLGEKGKGIAICEKVPQNIKEGAGHDYERDDNITANSSELQADTHAIILSQVNAGESAFVENESAGTIEERQGKLTSSVTDDDAMPYNIDGLDTSTWFDQIYDNSPPFDAVPDEPASERMQLDPDLCNPNASAPAVVGHNTNSFLASLRQMTAAPSTMNRCCSNAFESRDEVLTGVSDTTCQAEDIGLPLVETELGKKRKIETINQLTDQRKLRDGTGFAGPSVGHSTKSTAIKYPFIAEKKNGWPTN